MTPTLAVAPARVRTRQVGVPAAVFAGCLALLLRHPAGHPAWHTLWAEDGHVFAQCAAQHGIGCLDTPWDGYVHVAPRLLVVLVTALPVGSWAVAASVLAIAMAAVALTVIWATTAWLLPGALTRAVAIFIVAASAAAHREVAGNLANLHWFLFAAALALAANPQARTGRTATLGRAGWLAVTCLSGPFGIVVLAAFGTGATLRARERGGWPWSDRVTGVVVLAAAAVQFHVMATSPRVDAGDRIGVLGALRLYVRLVLRIGWVGPRRGTSELALAASLAFLALVVAGLWHSRRRRQRRRVIAGAALLVASPVFYVTLVLLNHGAAFRYTSVPFLMVIVGGMALMVEACSGWAPGQAAVLGLGAALLAGMLAIGPYAPSVSEHGPAWPTAVAAARASCRAGHDVTEKIDTAPAPEWSIQLTCRRLLSG